MKLICWILLLSVSLAAQVTAPTVKPIAASDFGRWTIPAATTVPAAGTFTVQLQFSLATATSGPSFSPVTNGTLLLIVDQGNNETVVPSSVNCPMGGVTCSFTATFIKSHRGNFMVSSGTFGLQEAVNYLLGNNGGTVQLTTDWPGNASTITAITGSASVSLQDIRNGLTLYTWTGSVYATPVTNTFNCGTTANPGIPFWNGTACLVDPNATLDGNGNLNLVTITASGAITGLTVGTTGNGGVFAGTMQTAPGTPGVNQYALYVDSITGNLTCLNHTLGDCMPASGGGGPTLQTNSINNTSQASLNMINPAAFHGLTFIFSNPSGGNETFTVGGSLDLATQTHASTIINGVTCSLGVVGCTIATGAGASAIESWDGDGSDGAVTADGTTTVTCLGAPAASTYTMTRDCYFTTLTVNTGVIIKTVSNRLLATVSLTSSGTIQNLATNGGAGVGATGTNKSTGGVNGSNSSILAAGSLSSPLAALAGKSGASGSTGVGTVGVAGTAGNTTASSLSSSASTAGVAGGNGGSSGASGGNNAGGVGGAGGSGVASTLAKSSPHELTRASDLDDSNGNSFQPRSGNGGSGSGASGGGDGANAGGGGGGSGGGGGNGGFIVLIAPTITLNGTSVINVSGGNGGNGGSGGTPTVGNCGGGGGGAGGDGGNGGVIVRIYNALTNTGTDTISGGAAGTGGGAGTGVGTGSAGTAGANGAAGASGSVFNLQLP